MKKLGHQILVKHRDFSPFEDENVPETNDAIEQQYEAASEEVFEKVMNVTEGSWQRSMQVTNSIWDIDKNEITDGDQV